MAGIDDPRERLDAYGVAYVRFAVEHPVHLRVMFTQRFETAKTTHPAFDLLRDTAAAVVGTGIDPTHAAVAAWRCRTGCRCSSSTVASRPR